MGHDVENARFEILKGIQTILADPRAKTAARFDRLEARTDRPDLGTRNDRRNAAGMLVTMRARAGDFDARVSGPDRLRIIRRKNALRRVGD
ncbi:hypothetical protein SAMN02799622_02991 [Methylobacterium sp. UNC378MF]|uniref:hypothetical protein n=1 Tax=Methylobacterium sp. UNC378MF TaxID=1502748 RepID=UPI000883D997|nr:hypothetical protein [Methylobacterium sp. UNC378MF]SDA22916.1 hypothetical protein SAMN02799622_02991 [Methylobacterium sp. UNC378MF]